MWPLLLLDSSFAAKAIPPHKMLDFESPIRFGAWGGIYGIFLLQGLGLSQFGAVGLKVCGFRIIRVEELRAFQFFVPIFGSIIMLSPGFGSATNLMCFIRVLRAEPASKHRISQVCSYMRKYNRLGFGVWGYVCRGCHGTKH